MWTDEFEESFGDLFDLQTRIAQGIVVSLGQELTGEAEATLAAAESSSVNAYDYYLQGADYVLAGDQESTEIGYLLFAQAVDRDPDLAEAHVGIGTVYGLRFWNGWGGGVGNLARAEASFQRARDLDPSNMRARRGFTQLHFYRGHIERMLRLAQEITRLGLDDIEALLAAGEAYTLGGLPEVAGPILGQVLALDPANQYASWLVLIRTFYFEEDFEEAAAAADTYVLRFGDDPYVYAMGAQAHLRRGDVDGARQRYDRAGELVEGLSPEFGLATFFEIDVLVTAGVFFDQHGEPGRARTLWEKGLELTQAALATDPDNVGFRLSLASFHGFLGERAALEREEALAVAALTDMDVSPYQWLYLIGTHAHLGNTERAFWILRRQREEGRRLPALGYVGTVAPDLLDTPEYADFRREYEAIMQRLQEQFAPAD